MTRTDVLSMRDQHLLAKANNMPYSEAVLQSCYMWLDNGNTKQRKGFVELSQPKED